MYEHTSNWAIHDDVAKEIVRLSRPIVIVELGVYAGYSLNTFCEAILENKLNTKVYGIDNWEGTPEVQNAAYYGLLKYEFCHLIKGNTTGLELLCPIDILHIDANHSFEGACEDFLHWLPQVSDNGILIMHDVMVNDGIQEWGEEFGTKSFFFDCVVPFYSCYVHKRDYGLGIIFKGKVPEWINGIKEVNKI